MGPKGKMTDEKKQEMFDAWQASAEYDIIKKFQGKRAEISRLELSLKDISWDIQPYLNAQFTMIQDLKVPGRKAKSYEQQYVRTMIFEKVQNEQKFIDGTTYTISNNAAVDMFNCKEALVDIYNILDPEQMQLECTFENYTSWKKDLIKKCKDWDKLYVKHIKATYPEMSQIHATAMKPLWLLIDSNLQLTRLEDMIAKDPTNIPEFRFIALEDEFIKHMTNVCDIFKEYGNMKDHPFDIKQMIKTLKIKDWKIITPFRYYLTPLQQALNKVRKELLRMHQVGHLLIKYIVEDNTDLQDFMTDLVKKDLLVQWLVGDELKQDQFRFIFETVNVIYDSALRDKFLASKDTDVIIDLVIPKLTAYKALMRIREIQLTKHKEEMAAKKKAQRQGIKKQPEQEEEKPKTEEQIYAKKIKEEEKGEDEAYLLSEAQKQAQLDKAEREKYGRYWVWEGYFNEKNKDIWLDTVEMLKNINDHILQDIEDAILLEGFKGTKAKNAQKEISNVINVDVQQRINNEKKLRNDDAQEFYDHEIQLNEKRKKLDTMRPPFCWNFFDDAQPEQKPKHVLRAEAQPLSEKIYVDGRVEKIMANIETIAMNLSRFEQVKWETLRKHTIEIFHYEYKDYQSKLQQIQES